MNRPRSSRQRYLLFVQDYKHRRLDDEVEAGENQKQIEDPAGEAAELPLPEARRSVKVARLEILPFSGVAGVRSPRQKASP